MSVRAQDLINKTNTWSQIQRLQYQKRKQGLEGIDDDKEEEGLQETAEGKLDELRKLDEQAQSVNKIVKTKIEDGTADFGRHSNAKSNSTKKKVQNTQRQRQFKDLEDAGTPDEGSVKKINLLGATPGATKTDFTPDALAGLSGDELTKEAQQLAASGDDGADVSKDDASSSPVEATDNAFEDEDELGLRTSKDGLKALDMDNYDPHEGTEPESSGSAESSKAETSADEDEDPVAPPAPVVQEASEQDVPLLPEDPADAPSTAQADAVSSKLDTEKPIIKSIDESIVDKSIDDAQLAMASSGEAPPTIIHFDKPEDTADWAQAKAGDPDDQDLVEDDSPRPPSFRALYRHEQTPASQHFLRASLGRENFGFQAISRTLGVAVKEKEEEAESDETEDDGSSGSSFGTKVKDMAFHHQVSGSDMPTEPDPGQMLRALESNVEKNRARREVENTGGFEISADN